MPWSRGLPAFAVLVGAGCAQAEQDGVHADAAKDTSLATEAAGDGPAPDSKADATDAATDGAKDADVTGDAATDGGDALLDATLDATIDSDIDSAIDSGVDSAIDSGPLDTGPLDTGATDTGDSGVTTATWSTTTLDHRCTVGATFTYLCPAGGSASSIWGTGEYTDDSSLCTAAVHAGKIGLTAGGTVTIEVRAGAAAYSGSTAFGVTSDTWGSWLCGFAFK